MIVERKESITVVLLFDVMFRIEFNKPKIVNAPNTTVDEREERVFGRLPRPHTWTYIINTNNYIST